MSITNNTLSDIRTAVKRRLNEVAADGVWTTAQLNTYINRALLRVAMDTEFDTRDSTINLRLNVAWYLLPSDTLVPRFLYGPSVWGQRKLFPTSMIALDRMDGYWERRTGTTTTHFIPFSYNRFILWPPPDRNTTITLHDCPMPATLTSDASTTGLPLPGQKAAELYATYLALRRYDFDKALVQLAQYKSAIEAAKVEQRNVTAFHTTKFRPGKQFEKAHGSPEFSRW